MIMSNEVYYNEPGYEREMGTTEGEKKNEAYKNIVKYCNIKYAMIEQIKNPPKGFEKVIRLNFYLKKEMILKEVREWIEKAKTADEDSSYTGVTGYHNSDWCNKFREKGAFLKAMKEIYVELETTLNSIENPFKDQ